MLERWAVMHPVPFEDYFIHPATKQGDILWTKDEYGEELVWESLAFTPSLF